MCVLVKSVLGSVCSGSNLWERSFRVWVWETQRLMKMLSGMKGREMWKICKWRLVWTVVQQTINYFFMAYESVCTSITAAEIIIIRFLLSIWYGWNLAFICEKILVDFYILFMYEFGIFVARGKCLHKFKVFSIAVFTCIFYSGLYQIDSIFLFLCLGWGFAVSLWFLNFMHPFILKLCCNDIQTLWRKENLCRSCHLLTILWVIPDCFFPVSIFSLGFGFYPCGTCFLCN